MRATGMPSSSAIVAAIDGDSRISVYPLNREIVELASTLSAVGEMHDRQIVATVLRLATTSGPFTLLTKDQNISSSRLVPVAW